MREIKYFLVLCGALAFSGCTGSQSSENGSDRGNEVEITQQPENSDTPESTTDEVEPEELDPTFSIPPSNQNFKEYIPTLMFHYIRDMPADSPDQLGYRLSFSPEKLEEFLIYFKENNIETLTYWDLKNIIEGKEEMPEKAVMLTFDDGHADHYTNAYRILEKYSMKGVFFIISGKPDNDWNYADWSQIKEMADSGHEIASHTINHPDLSNMSIDMVRQELEVSKSTIEEKIGKPVISFCYPAGKYNSTVLSIVEENYLFARTTNPGRYVSVSERFELPTQRIFPDTGTASLDAWFS
jgi:peptidoglycan/xylan/chitin deacetylase (PgdA/CDA1 family)